MFEKKLLLNILSMGSFIEMKLPAPEGRGASFSSTLDKMQH